jgi:hypothetical protein
LEFETNIDVSRKECLNEELELSAINYLKKYDCYLNTITNLLWKLKFS